MMADDLYDLIATKYPNRTIWIEVAEDGENGAVIRYNLTQPVLSIKL
jgi:hypothetical protein